MLKSGKQKLIFAVILCLISMVGAYLVQTGNGKIEVKDLRWETASGSRMSALLFKPKSATADNPAPAIVTSHGWFNNREMQDLNYVELARRGYVVMSIDMFGHGNSDTLIAAQHLARGVGMYDAVELMATLPYVNKAQIGVTGHSNGAMAANLSVDVDNLKAEPLIASVLLVANDATYRNTKGVYYNKYGSRDVGIVAAKYDEFFFRTALPDGTRTPPREYIFQPQAQSFLHFGKDPAGLNQRESYTIYQEEVDGKDTIRVIYNPNQIHPWNHFSKNVVVSALEFFEASLPAPNPIDPHKQTWQWKAFFNFLGLVGFVLFLINFTIVLLDTKYFGVLRAKQPIQPQPAPEGKGKAWFWGGLLATAAVSAYAYIKLYGWTTANRPKLFLQSPPYYIGMWSLVVGLFSLAFMIVFYFAFGRKEGGVNLRERGVWLSGRDLWRSIVLAFTVVVASYSLVFIADYFFKVDFRLWVLPLKAFEVSKLGIMVRYLPFFLVFYIINSVSVNCFNYVATGKKEWVNTALLALFNGLSSIVLVAVQYLTFFITGHLTKSISSIGGIWLFPMVVILPLAAVISRSIYKRTKNPYIAALIIAMIVTIISCANTLTQL